MVTVVQLVRASDCGSECRGFESLQSPLKERGISVMIFLFLCYIIYQTFGKIIFSDIAVEILLFVS